MAYCECLVSTLRFVFKCLFGHYTTIQLHSLLLFVCICIEWMLVYNVSKHSSFSKLSHYVRTDEEFLKAHNTYAESSQQAKRDMLAWLSDPRNGFKMSYMNTTNQSYGLFGELKDEKSLCIGIMSKRRYIDEQEPRYYLTQTLMSILTRIQLKYQDRVLVRLYNVDAQPNEHKELLELAKLVTHETIDARTMASVPITINLNERLKIKESIDYAIVLRRLHAIENCEYALAIEDDCIAANNWYEGILDSLDQLEQDSFFRYKWFSIKYFTSFRYFDWLIHLKTVFKYVIYSTLLTLVQCYLFQKFTSRIRGSFQQNNLYNFKANATQITFACAHMNLATFLSIILSIHTFVLVFWLYSTSVEPIGQGLKWFSQGFNTVAMLYPRRNLIKLAEFFESKLLRFYETGQFEPSDIAMKEFMNRRGLYQLVYEPCLFQHAGLHSSLGYRTLYNIHEYQYEPFLSYSFRDHGRPITFESFFSSLS